MTTSILLTGGLGYLGGRIAQRLVAAGYDVRCGTRQPAMPTPAWIPEMSMVHLDWDSEDTLVQGCLGVDSIIHLAAMNEVDSANNPIGALKMNALASLRLLEVAKRSGVRRFIYFSTAHVYGAPLHGNIDEGTLPRPVHPYAITHRVTEDFLLAAHDRREIEGVVVRLSNSFGAPVTPDINRWTLLVNDLCRQAVTHGELRLNSAGTQLRDFITLADVAGAVDHLLRLELSSVGDGLFNLGSGHASTILAKTELVAARWRALTGKDIAIRLSKDELVPALALNYCCDRLFGTGFKLSNQINQEIDDTLRLCMRAFGK